MLYLSQAYRILEDALRKKLLIRVDPSTRSTLQLNAKNRVSVLSPQIGVTLVELMLSLSLGLIISAASFQLFANSMNIQRIQQSLSEVQDASVFSMNTLNQEIGKANLGSALPMYQESAWTGIVLTGSINTNEREGGTYLKSGNLKDINGIEASLLTRNSAGPSNVQTPTKSDQLTIQYRAPSDSYDCEGQKVNQGDRVIERFFTRYDNQRASHETRNLAIVLACDAGRYTLNPAIDSKVSNQETIKVSGFGGGGSILINRVDYFAVKLGVKFPEGVIYMPINQYLTKDTYGNYTFNLPIVSVQIGIISRGSTTIDTAVRHAFNTVSNSSKTNFTVNGSEHTLNEQAPSYIRRSLQSVVYLRNNYSSL